MLTLLPCSRKHSVKGFFFFYLGDININPGSATVSNNNIPLNNLSFYNRDKPNMPSQWNSSDCSFQVEDFRKRRPTYFIFEFQ